MKPHICIGPERDPYRIVCLCVRGEDHPEELFDVPVGQEDLDDPEG